MRDAPSASGGGVAITQGGLLGGRLAYRQLRAGRRTGFEPVLLAASVPARPAEKVLEAGTGAGAGLLCLAHRVPGIEATGIEIQPELAELANENFKINGLQGVVCLAQAIGEAGFGAVFDHVLANPPWHDAAGTPSPDPLRALAHRAAAGLLAEWIGGLTRFLKPGGSLTLILPAAKYAEAAACLRPLGYGGLRLFPLWPRGDRPAKMLLLGARRHSALPDAILPGLVLHDDAGITAAAQAILRDGAATALAASPVARRDRRSASDRPARDRAGSC